MIYNKRSARIYDNDRYTGDGNDDLEYVAKKLNLIETGDGVPKSDTVMQGNKTDLIGESKVLISSILLY